MDEMQISADQIIFIGDTAGDISEGKQAGVETIGVSWGYNTKEQISDAKPDFIADTVEELGELLKNELKK